MTQSKSKKLTATQILDRLVEMLGQDCAENRQAAAVVFRELAESSTKVVAGLRKATQRSDDPVLRRLAVEALGEIAPPTLVRDVQGCLRDEDEDVEQAARRVLSSGKGVTAEDVAKMLASDDAELRISAIAVLGAMGTKDARKEILGALVDNRAAVRQAVQDALTPLYKRLSDKEVVGELERVADAADAAGYLEDSAVGALVAKVVAALERDGAVDLLIELAERHADKAVKQHAVEGMRRCIKEKKTAARAFRTLLRLVEEGETQLAAAAATTLDPLDVPIEHEARVRELVSSDEAAVRRWAIGALGRLDSTPAARALAEVVHVGGAANRDQALEAALANECGRTELARLLGRLEDAERARLVARGLRERKEQLSPPTLKAIEEAAIDTDSEVGEIVLQLLRHLGIQLKSGASDELLDQALELKDAQRFREAADLFSRMLRGNSDPETRYQLGVCQLKMSKRKVARGPSKDPCLKTFRSLQSNRDFPLVQRLHQESTVQADELYYLGFTFAEGQEVDQGLGGDILLLLTENGAPEKLERMAKNKLVTMGWLEA